MSQAERRKFDGDDGYVQTITTGGLVAPRSIAFAPVACEPVPGTSEQGIDSDCDVACDRRQTDRPPTP